MDEPEAALSPQRKLSLFIQIVIMAEKGSQFIIATHSPILLGFQAQVYIHLTIVRLVLVNMKKTELYSLFKNAIM